MRFKGLRILVAISLVMFILIVGNIYVFGFLKENDDRSDSDVRILLPPSYSEKNPLASYEDNTQNPPQKPEKPIVSSSPVTVVHNSVKTRAS